jgi:hypothetical protein
VSEKLVSSQFNPATAVPHISPTDGLGWGGIRVLVMDERKGLSADFQTAFSLLPNRDTRDPLNTSGLTPSVTAILEPRSSQRFTSEQGWEMEEAGALMASLSYHRLFHFLISYIC